jgi:phosphoglycolate phosphatase-like HAD superfamily hydrolase
MKVKNNGSIPWQAIRAWLFDLDGTLMNTDEQAVENLAHRLRFLGRPRARRLARRMVMLGESPLNDLITLLDRLGLDPFFFALVHRLSRGIPLFPIVEGVAPLLDYLADRAALGIVTTRSRVAAEAFLHQHDLTDLISVLVTQTTTRRLKPHPEPVLVAAQRLDVAPEACVVVGDTPGDLLAARQAGAWAVGVLCGFGEAAELRRAGAHLIVDSTADLLSLLEAELDPR